MVPADALTADEVLGAGRLQGRVYTISVMYRVPRALQDDALELLRLGEKESGKLGLSDNI